MKLMPWKKKKDGTRRSGGDGPHALGRLRSEVDHLFERFFTQPWGALEAPGFVGWRPPLDVRDGEKEVTVRAELPGMDPKSIDISIVDRTLTISGEKRQEKEERDGNVTRSECHYGSFRRSMELPHGVDPDRVSAEYAHGVLTLRIAKTQAAEARRIPVSVK